MPQTSAWIYPWDLVDAAGPMEGVVRSSLDRIDVAASYHSILATFPGRRRHRFVDVDRTLFYVRPDRTVWEGATIVPTISPLVDEIDALEEGRAFAERCGVGLAAWAVLLHDANLPRRHPAAAQRTLWGDALPSLLCLRSALVRDYAARLIADVAGRADTVQLESASWGTLPHHRHSKLPGRAPNVQAAILELCFCDACAADADAHGIDVAALRAGLDRLWDLSFEKALDPESALSAVPGYEPYRLRRAAAVTELASLATGLAERVEIVVFGDRSRTGVRIADLCATGASVRVLAYGDADRVRRIRQAVAQEAPGAAVAWGLSVLPEHVGVREDFAAAWDETRDSDVGVYHLGMATDDRRGWIEHAVAARSRQRGHHDD